MNKDLCSNKACSNYGRYSRYCHHVSYTVPVQKEVNKVSDNQKEILKEYKKVREAFLKEHPNCQVKLDGCKTKAVEVHHKAGKATKELYLDDKLFLAVCRHCHGILEKNVVFAKQMGFSISRLSKTLAKK